MYQHILVALEGKPTDEAAIACASRLADENSCRLTLLEVIGVAPAAGGMRHLQIETGSYGWRHKMRAESRMRELQERLGLRNGLLKTVIMVSDRDEADEIVDYANQGNCDLIVMAADGRSWWQRTLHGCIADGVHRKATVPTLFVSDGTRRERVARRTAPLVIPALEVLGHVDL